MNALRQYLQGDSVGLLISPKGVDVDQFDVEVFLYTTTAGYKVRATSVPCGTCLPLARQWGGELLLFLPPEITRKMDVGLCVMETTYTHRPTGAKMTLQDKVFYLNRAKHTDNEHKHQ